ncbi:MAG: deoC [Phycisphaerales bacterium]|nr:deoC [Phycisphaerales bacterium]
MTRTELAAKIDHTILKPEATEAEVLRVAAEGAHHRFASICVAPAWVAKVAAALRGSDVPVCSVVAFPHGTSKATVKAIEATVAVKDGAGEIDVVAHLPHLAAGDLDAVRAELLEVARAARAVRRDVVLKVILETAYLLSLGSERGEAAIAAGCRAARESGFDFVKTSTGFHPAGGASTMAVALLKKYGEGMLVKASGGIRDWPMAKAMLDAGADRLGMSASVGVLSAEC